MSRRLVKGQFHVFYSGTHQLGSQPDGDPVWFTPDDFYPLRGLDGWDGQVSIVAEDSGSAGNTRYWPEDLVGVPR